jgi:alpha-2-macroglobulin
MRTHDSSDAIGGRKRRRASRLVLINLLLILSLACSLPALNRSTPAPAPAPAPDTSPQPSASLPLPEPTPLPPALVESQPVPGAEIPLTGPLKLYFNQPMDPRSVEEALSGQPSLAGSFTWENDKVLVFQPERPFAPASELTIQISSSARSKQGLQLINPLSISFRTVGFLHLTQALPPEGSPAVDPTTPVVASFNRPVFPLGFPGEDQAAGNILSLDPPVEGRGEWINTSTYIFYPQPALAAGQTYTVQVNPDLHGLDGSPLAEEDEAGRAHPLRWTFTTSLPELLSIRPTGGIEGGNLEIPLDAQVVLTFSQAMDMQSIVESFALLNPAGERFPVSLQENSNATTFVFTPDRLLDRSARYSAVLSAGARTLGGTPSAQSATYAFYTVGPLRVSSSVPQQGGQMPPYMGITLEFSANLPPNGLDRYLQFSPPVENMGSYLDFNQKTLQIYGSFAPETSYTLTVDSALQDAWGMSLGTPYVLAFRTLPLDPSLSVGFGSDVLFLTPQDAVLPVQVVNLNSLAFTLGSVPLDDFLSLLGPNGYEIRQTYQPGGSAIRQQSFTIEPNRSQTVGLDLDDGVQGLAPGLYYVRLNPGRPNIYTTPLLLVVSRLQVTYKISPTDVLVWAVDLESGSPAAGAPVAIYNEAGEVLASGMTDSQGVYRSQIPLQQDMYPLSTAVVGSPGGALFGAALSHWNMGLSPWSFGIREDPNPPQLKTHLYTDRPIYRPGDVVFFKGLSRHQREGRYALPELSSQTVHLYNEMGEFVQAIDAPYTEFGTFSSLLYLPAGLNPGQYRLAVGDSYLNAVFFQVAEYRKPEIEMNVEVLQDEAAIGDQLQARIEAKYFFGAPASNLPVRWSIYAVAEQFLLDQYSVGPLDLSWMDAFHRSIYSGMYGDWIASGEGQTGPDGVLEIDFQAVLPRESRANIPFRFTLEVSLTDETAMPVLGRDSLLVHPAPLYIGIKPDQFLVDAGSELGFAVQLVDWQKQPAGEHTLSASFQKVTWTRSDLFEYDPMQPQYQAVYEPVGHTRFVTGEDGVARLAFFPPQPGVYQLEVRSEDPALASAVTQILVWAAGPGDAVWPAQPNQRLELTPDRQQYLPGDSAQVFIPNPFGVPVQALITIERSSILRHQVITLGESGSPVTIPLTAEDAPNVYLSAILLGRDGRGLPDFRFGLANLPVEPVEQTLFVEILGVPDQPLAPGDSLSLGVRAEDASGAPVRAEFSLAVVDQAVLALAEPNAPPVLEAFYGEQPLGVRTGMSLAGYIGRLMSMLPGGGGGGEGMTILMVREDYQDTALWRADLVTDSSGEAWVTFSLPANLTGWQIEARGITQDSRVGQAQSEMQTVKDLFIRPVTPRFLVAGDYVQLAAVVHNNTSEAIQAEVVLQAQNVTLENLDQVQTVLVPAAGRVRVEWWGRVQEVSQVDLIFSVSGAGLHDAARPVTPSASQERLGAGAIPVLRYTTRQTFSVSGFLDQPGERMELVSLPVSFSATGAALSLELSPSLAASLLSSLDPLERIPYESTEQLVSRLLPNLEMDQALAQLGTSSPELNQRLQTQLTDNLRRLLLRQNLDGGWGWGSRPGGHIPV